MKEPIFEHGGKSAESYRNVYVGARNSFLREEIDIRINKMRNRWLGSYTKKCGATAEVVFGIARELERRELEAN